MSSSDTHNNNQNNDDNHSHVISQVSVEEDSPENIIQILKNKDESYNNDTSEKSNKITCTNTSTNNADDTSEKKRQRPVDLKVMDNGNSNIVEVFIHHLFVYFNRFIFYINFLF